MKRMLGLMAGVVLSLSFLGCGKTAAVQQTKGPLPLSLQKCVNREHGL